MSGVSSGEPPQLWELESVFGNVVGVLIGILGIALFVMLVIGGFRFITSGGNADKVAGAKNTITWAIIGVVLAALAYLILVLISSFTGQTGILNFTIFQGQR